jgi:hypothetical protein
MSRLCRVLLIAILALGVAAPSAGAASPGDYLGAMWKTVLETPSPQNPFVTGKPVCIDLGGVVAPFGAGSKDFTCRVKPATQILVAAYSSECSTMEVGTAFFGRNEAELRACSHRVNNKVKLTEVSLDGKPLATTEVMSGLLTINLPEKNIFGLPAGTGGQPGLPYLSVADGFVALIPSLSLGTHTIGLHITGESPPGTPLDVSNTTTIVVTPGG